MNKKEKAIIDIFNKIEIELIKNISSKFKNDYIFDFETFTKKELSRWELQKLAELGKLTKENIKIIKQNSKELSGLLEDYLKETALQSIEEIEPEFLKGVKRNFLKPTKKPMISNAVKQIVKYYSKQAKDEYNLTNTTMLKSSQQKYRDIINKTSFQLASGIYTPQEAVKNTIKEFGKEGITALTDKSGRNWTPEGYVRMVNRTTTNNIITKAQQERCKDYGVNLIEISSHSGARPLCAPYQGKIYSIDGKDGFVEDFNGKKIKYESFSTTSYGQPAGLFGINCTHRQYPFIAGISELKEYDISKSENDELYKLTQTQRKYERDIRKTKREIEAVNSAGLDIKDLKQKLKNQQSKIKNFTEKNDLVRQRDREQIY